MTTSIRHFVMFTIAAGPFLWPPQSCLGIDGNDPAPSNQSPSLAQPPSAPARPPAPPDPQAIPQDLVLAVMAIERGQFAEAVFRVDDYVTRFGDSAKATFVRGLILHKQKLYDQARPLFEKTISLEPGFVVVHHFLGYCLYYLGEIPAARAAFERHLELRPDTADSHFGLGLVAIEEDNLDEAWMRFEKSIELNQKTLAQRPDRLSIKADISKAYIREGDIAVRRDELAQARELIEKGLRLWPDHYEGWHKLSRVCQRLGDDEAAKIAMQRHDAVRDRLRPRVQAPDPRLQSPSAPQSTQQEKP